MSPYEPQPIVSPQVPSRRRPKLDRGAAHPGRVNHAEAHNEGGPEIR